MPPARVLIPNWGPGRTTPFDDRHIKAKLEEIDQTKEEKGHIASMIEDSEIILKAVGAKMTKENEEERPLLEVIRVGSFPMGTMLKGETALEMVLLCKEKPNLKILTEVFCLIKEQEVAAKFTVEQDRENALISLSRPLEAETFTLNLLFTSNMFQNEAAETADPDPVDILPRNKCLEYLTRLHQAQFFQSCAHPMVNSVPVARVVKTITRACPTWSVLTPWVTSLLVQRSMESAGHPTTAGDGLRRFFSILACGLILPGNHGLADPTSPGDILAALTKQDREDITNKAQLALRHIAFNQIHCVLGIEKIERGGAQVKAEAQAAEDTAVSA